MIENKPLELYFHIPFCERKCLYCDFLSAPGEEAQKEAYMRALLLEAAERGKRMAYKEQEENERVRRVVTSVFLGGGTPSVIPGKWIQALLDIVREHYFLTGDAEITMEVNPGTVDRDKLAAYRRAGINRLSIGLQSAKDEELVALGRIHTFAQFLDTWENARAEGFANMNVDVMSALPGQTLESYLETLHRVLELKQPPEHISAYSLIVEEGTPFASAAAAGKLELPDEECERMMYVETERILREHGYYRYEISNYARPGYECRHNCGYWKRTDYLGFGIGAASLLSNVRFRNGNDLKRYLKAPLECREEVQELTKEEQMEEFVFLGLRMTEGISPIKFQQLFGVTMEEIYGGVISKNKEDGLLFEKEDPETGQRRIGLTSRGLDLSNYCMAQFLLT